MHLIKKSLFPFIYCCETLTSLRGGGACLLHSPRHGGLDKTLQVAQINEASSNTPGEHRVKKPPLFICPLTEAALLPPRHQKA